MNTYEYGYKAPFFTNEIGVVNCSLTYMNFSRIFFFENRCSSKFSPLYTSLPAPSHGNF